jgi:ketosteroid isomerase-like protein
MNREEADGLAERIITAWNGQDVEEVVSCYTEDCIYRDPNTRGQVFGHEDLRRYLSRLFRDWKMHWSSRESFLLADAEGMAFLWRAELTPSGGAKTYAIDGMDLAVVRGNRLCRNEVYFDRTALLGGK